MSGALARDRWLDAQTAVLGSVLIDPEPLAARMLAELGPEDFREGEFRRLYLAVAALVRAGEPVDAVTVLDKAGRQLGPLIMEIMQATPTAANYEAYVRLCREQSRLAELRRLGADLGAAENLGAARELLRRMEAAAAERENIRVLSMGDAMREFYDDHQRGARVYVDWGIPALNEVLLATPGKVVVLGGYPSAGKSAMMLQMARSLGRSMRVGIFSFETDSRELMDRTVSHAAGVDFGRIMRSQLTAQDWQKIAASGADIVGRKVDFIPAAGMNFHDVLSLTLSGQYRAIFLDYVQEVVPERRQGGTRQEEVAGLSMALATLARRHGVLVVELSQLSRAVRGRDGGAKAPDMASLRESGQLEQDADAILLLYRTDPNRSDSPRKLELVKNKTGPLADLVLRFDGRTQTFSFDPGAQYRAEGRRAKQRARGGGAAAEPSPFGPETEAEEDAAALWDTLPGE